jgi:NADP-dependent 3-hydroxy acid dehydrogenase YdfG
MPLSDYRRALVTGASSGIGLAIAESLRGAGMEVHASALPDSGLEAAAHRLGAIPHALDLTAPGAAERLIAASDPDIVINNAGILGPYGPLERASPADIDRLIATNLNQAVHLTRAALPALLARKLGHIVFTGSIAGRIPGAGYAVYAATKAGILAFADGLRWDLLGSGVRTTVLVPGRVETHIYDRHFGNHANARTALYEGVEAVQPADVARIVISALDMPRHVDMTIVEVMPTDQVFGGSQIAKRPPAH